MSRTGESNAAGDSVNIIDILYSFFNKKYETENDGQQIPADADIVATASNSSAKAKEIGHDLAVLGDLLERDHRATIDRQVERLRDLGGCSFKNFCEVAKHILTDNFNWGRVVTFLCFGYRLAVNYNNYTSSDFIMTIFKMLVKYFIDHLTKWIADHGGWDRAVQDVIKSISLPTPVFLAGMVAGVGVAVAVAAITLFVWMRSKSS